MSGFSDEDLRAMAGRPNQMGIAIFEATRRLQDSLVAEEIATRKLTDVLVALTRWLVLFTAMLVLLSAALAFTTIRQTRVVHGYAGNVYPASTTASGLTRDW